MRKCVTLFSVAALLAIASVAAAVEAETAPKGEEGWVSLFNGKNLDGWKQVGDAVWKVEDGMIVGRQGPDAKGGDLLSAKEFDNFELQVVYKCKWPCNSGVWFRYQNPKLAYQADILEYKQPEAYTGTVYSPGVAQLFLSRNLNKGIEKRDDWNTFLIRAEGEQIVVHLNKKKVGEFKSDRTMKGRVGFQVHPGAEFKDGMVVWIKEAKIRQLGEDGQ
jgi:hypothetical protein